jgi:HD-GYP domain-containing protein (c-di-GMP phosphodiesterase class II)
LEEWRERAAQNDAIRTLLARLDEHAPGERAHAERVAVYAVAMADELEMSEQDLLIIRWAAQLHDIGKFDLPASLLAAGPISDTDWRLIKTHPKRAEKYLTELAFLTPAIPMIVAHHERNDGSGYPKCLAGDIPVGAQIIGIAEAFDAMVSWGGKSEEEALAELSAGPFDSNLVQALTKVQPLIQPLV